MAIAFDDWWDNNRTGTGTTQSWSHTPLGTPRAVVVAVTHGASSTEHVSSVTYGGVAMTPVVSAADTGGEPGRTSLFFLGSGVPTGTQTVLVTYSTGTTDDTHATSVTFTAALDCEVIDFDVVEGDATNPSITLQAGGRQNSVFSSLYAGGDSLGLVTDGTGTTRDTSSDQGSWGSLTGHRTTPGTTDFTYQWTMASDDVAMAALMIAESVTAKSGTDTAGGDEDWSEVDTNSIETSSGADSVSGLLTGPPSQTDSGSVSSEGSSVVVVVVSTDYFYASDSGNVLNLNPIVIVGYLRLSDEGLTQIPHLAPLVQAEDSISSPLQPNGPNISSSGLSEPPSSRKIAPLAPAY
jgi:hypothetical protein